MRQKGTGQIGSKFSLEHFGIFCEALYKTFLQSDEYAEIANRGEVPNNSTKNWELFFEHIIKNYDNNFLAQAFAESIQAKLQKPIEKGAISYDIIMAIA